MNNQTWYTYRIFLYVHSSDIFFFSKKENTLMSLLGLKSINCRHLFTTLQRFQHKRKKKQFLCKSIKIYLHSQLPIFFKRRAINEWPKYLEEQWGIKQSREPFSLSLFPMIEPSLWWTERYFIAVFFTHFWLWPEQLQKDYLNKAEKKDKNLTRIIIFVKLSPYCLSRQSQTNVQAQSFVF